MELMDKFYFDLGLDPNFRIAEDASGLNETTTMLRLKRFADKYHISGEFDAKSAVRSETAEGMLTGAAVLRDCYGKINYFIAPFSSPLFPGAAKVLKAYRKDIQVIGVAADDRTVSTTPEQTDALIRVSAKDIEDTIGELKKLENITIGYQSAAALFAAKEKALAVKDRHARYVVLFTD